MFIGLFIRVETSDLGSRMRITDARMNETFLPLATVICYLILK